MTTSGTYNYSISVSDIINEAVLNLGKLGENDSLTSQEYSDCVRKLNLIIKQFMGKADFSKGIKQWTRRQGYVFLSNNSYLYTLGSPTLNNNDWTNSFVSTSLMYNALANATAITVNSSSGISALDNIGIELSSGNLFWTTVVSVLGNVITLSTMLPLSSGVGSIVYDYTTIAQRPIEIEWAVLRDSTNNDTPLTLLNYEDYANLPSKTQLTNISDPTSIYVENMLSYSNLYTDVGAANDLTKYIVIGYQEPIQDLSGNPSETIEYPQEYYRAIVWLLTREICPMFLSNWTQLMAELLKESLMIATDKDPANSTYYFQTY